jgi:hypothetical protein
MIHIYEIEDQGWEVFDQDPQGDWSHYIRTLQNDNEFDLYLDICRAQGLDFILHTLEEYDEYHLSLSV